MTNHLEHLTHNHQMAKDAANHVKKITDRWIDVDMKVKAAIKELESQIDGGEECNARDQEISLVIRILKGQE